MRFQDYTLVTTHKKPFLNLLIDFFALYTAEAKEKADWEAQPSCGESIIGLE